MKGVTVEGNGEYGVWVHSEGAVAKLDGCTVRDNKKGDYREAGGGRIGSKEEH